MAQNYNVTITYTGILTYDVEAENPKEAKEKAEAYFNQDEMSLPENHKYNFKVAKTDFVTAQPTQEL